MDYTSLNNLFEDGQEVFVGVTLVKQDGKFIVKSQFAKLQGSGSYQKKKTTPKKATKTNKLKEEFNEVQIDDFEF